MERVLYVQKEYPGDLVHGGIMVRSLYLPAEELDIRFLSAEEGGDTVVKVTEEELGKPMRVGPYRLGETPEIYAGNMLKERYDSIAEHAREMYQAAQVFEAKRESVRPLFEELKTDTQKAIWKAQKKDKQ